jgi:hypothetical protein
MLIVLNNYDEQVYLSITLYDIDLNRRICDSKFCSGFEAVYMCRPKAIAQAQADAS